MIRNNKASHWLGGIGQGSADGQRSNRLMTTSGNLSCRWPQVMGYGRQLSNTGSKRGQTIRGEVGTWKQDRFQITEFRFDPRGSNFKPQ